MSGKTGVNGMFVDQRISSHTMLSRTLWQVGFPDQARDCAQEGLTLARSIDHALSLCFVLAHRVIPIALWRGEKAVAEDMTQLLLAHSREHGFFIWHGFGRAYHTALSLDAKSTHLAQCRRDQGGNNVQGTILAQWRRPHGDRGSDIPDNGDWQIGRRQLPTAFQPSPTAWPLALSASATVSK
jgi:hypothetical protein